MRKSDVEVKEVLCSETGKPMPKIPLWMADIKVKFVSDESRQKGSPLPGVAEIESRRKGATAVAEIDELKEVDVAGAVIDDAGADEYDDADPEELGEEDIEV